MSLRDSFARGFSGPLGAASKEPPVSGEHVPSERDLRRRGARHGIGKVVLVAFLVMVVTSVCALSVLAEGKTGHWKFVSAEVYSSNGTLNSYKYKYQWVDEGDGNSAVSEALTDGSGHTTDSDGTYTSPTIGTTMTPASTVVPTWVPTGWNQGTNDNTNTTPTTDPATGGSTAAATAASGVTDSDPISKAPNWSLSWDAISKGLIHFAYESFLSPISKFNMQLGGYMLSAINTQSLFNQDFSTGTFQTFYLVASTISTKVAVPYGTAFLALVFSLALLRSANPRSKRTGPEWMSEFLGIVLLFMIAWTLITHAMDVMAALYWLGKNLVEVIERALDSINVGYNGSAFGTSVSSALTTQLDSLTYGQFAQAFLYLILSIATIGICFSCVLYIFSVGFIRMAEIYLRSAFAAIPMAFFAAESTRHFAWAYIKRFAAVCFQAGIIVVALALAGLFFGIAGTLISTTFGDTSLLQGDLATGFAAAFVSILPALVALGTVTGIVKKSEGVANALFGLQ